MKEDTHFIFALIVMLGLFMSMLLVLYEDGVSFALLKKLRCKLRLHKFDKKIATTKMKLYYCTYCKTKRVHPPLKVIQGEKKDMGSFKF
jgi:hypothetical protein